MLSMNEPSFCYIGKVALVEKREVGGGKRKEIDLQLFLFWKGEKRAKRIVFKLDILVSMREGSK